MVGALFPAAIEIELTCQVFRGADRSRGAGDLVGQRRGERHQFPRPRELLRASAHGRFGLFQPVPRPAQPHTHRQVFARLVRQVMRLVNDEDGFLGRRQDHATA